MLKTWQLQQTNKDFSLQSGLWFYYRYGNLIFFPCSPKKHWLDSFIFAAKSIIMRNISLVLNIVLLISVGILYYLHFKTKPGTTDEDESTNRYLPVSNSGIVFVNSDSLLDEYEFYKNEKKQFEAAQNRIKNELQSQGEKLQQEVEVYQQQAIGMTDTERAKKEEQLTMKQQQIMQKKEELLDKLDADQSKSSEELYSRLNKYLKKLNNGRNYNYVLGFQKGGGILFANDSLNITKDVVEGLNKEYAEEKGN